MGLGVTIVFFSGCIMVAIHYNNSQSMVFSYNDVSFWDENCIKKWGKWIIGLWGSCRDAVLIVLDMEMAIC
jgi:hypothetical protein